MTDMGNSASNKASKKKIKITHPADILPLLTRWKGRRQENFLAITLDGGHTVIKIHHITKGLLNRTMVHPRECFFPTIKDYAAAVIFVHNHPSGSISPSCEDEDVTSQLCMAGEILGINVLDHIIITKSNDYYSFRKEGKIKNKFSYEQIEKFVAELVAERS